MNNRTGNPANGAGSTNLDNKLDSIKESVKGLVDQGHEKVDAIKHRVVEVKDQAMTRGNDVLDKATDLIKANPFKAVGIAFGVGYIGMRLFRR
jgi:ElaB/YqjD/DUF883 family membrane-anchored ribosome-binding protein